MKLYVVYGGFPPDDDWIDTIFLDRDSAIIRLKEIRDGIKLQVKHGYMEVYEANKKNGMIEDEGISYHEDFSIV